MCALRQGVYVAWIVSNLAAITNAHLNLTD